MNESFSGTTSKNISAGWAKVDFTPAGAVPLAGYTHLTGRKSTGVHDPVYARAIVLRQDGGPDVALVMYDLLIVTEDMYQGLKARLADTGLEVMCTATHTHSSCGGFWDSLLGWAFLGRFRPGILKTLLDAGEKAVREALQNVGSATIHAGVSTIPGLNGNRRDHDGPVDEVLHVIRLRREDSDAVLFSYPGHPVIAAERDHHVISADFPGEAAARIEKYFSFAMYLPGALGGVDVKFPTTKVTLDENMEMMAAPLATMALQVARSAPEVSESPKGFLAHSVRELHFDRPRIRWSYDDDRKPFDFLLDRISNRLARPVPRIARVEGFRLGNVALIGFPSDLGIGVSLRVKALGAQYGLADVVTMSQTGGCVGYVHHPDDYAKTPADKGEAIQMGRYENAMNFFGHDTGTRFIQAAGEVLEQIGQ